MYKQKQEYEKTLSVMSNLHSNWFLKLSSENID